MLPTPKSTPSPRLATTIPVLGSECDASVKYPLGSFQSPPRSPALPPACYGTDGVSCGEHMEFHGLSSISVYRFSLPYTYSTSPNFQRLAAAGATLEKAINELQHAVETQSFRISCPRASGCRGCDEWWTLEGFSDFNICQACLDSAFAGTVFPQYFYRAARTDSEQSIHCNFGSPWLQIAWQLTRQRMWYDLGFLQAVLDIDRTRHSCYESSADRTWYTLVDKHGHALKDFHICSGDKKKVGLLLPSLHSYFTRTKPSHRKQRCDFRSDSVRLQEYLDLLVGIDAHATRKGRKPSLSSFYDLVRDKVQLPECSRDTTLQG